MNTVEGVKKWVSTKYTMNDIDDITDENKIIVDSMEVVFAAKNLLKLLGKENIVACCDSTCNCIWNRWPFHIFGVMDKHHHFHPAGYMFASNEDTDSYICLLQSLCNLYEKMFENEPNVNYTLNDNSDAIFKAFKTVFPLAF